MLESALYPRTACAMFRTCATALALASHCAGTRISLSAWEWYVPCRYTGYGTRHLAYNKYMASLLPRELYYRLQRFLRADVTDLIEECSAIWSAAWEMGGAVCGDEADVPHSGGRCLGLRQYIARKPHSTGIKLYVLADNGGGLRLRCLPLHRASWQGPALWVMWRQV